MKARVEVSGLAELRRELKRLKKLDTLVEFREGLKAAARIVATDAQRRVRSRSGRTRDSIRATAGGNTAYVVGGKAKVPWYGWLDFGTRRPKTGQPRSVGPWAHSGKGPKKGRFIYPALDAKEREVTKAVSAAVDIATKRGGF